MNDSPPTVLTCAQPTGQLHLGNYLGAVKQWVELLDGHQCFFGIVDLHAITLPYKPADLRKSCYECAAQYIAAGLDPERCSIFLQSQVSGHTELAWVLGCLTPIGELQRMTQFKDKSTKDNGGFIGAGLLYYPVLMAADILLYNADLVPVGQDQKQHLELCRNLAERFNHTYSDTFTIPAPYIPPTGARIMSLQHPERKMSKSDSNQSGTLYLLDEPKVLRKKIMSAVTDSDSLIQAREDKPGVSNLLNILSALSGRSVADWETQLAGQNYGQLKEEVYQVVEQAFAPIRQRYQSLISNQDHLDEVLQSGAHKAQKLAYKTLSKVYRKAGFPQKKR